MSARAERGEPGPGGRPARPLRRERGYLPIEDHGLLADGRSAALVGRDGTISWMCVPRFDSPPLFCALLDAEKGGAFQLHPEGLVESRQRYLPGTAVLETELHGRTGVVRLRDAMLLRAGADLREDAAADRGELLRVAEVLRGPVRLRVCISPRGGCTAEPRAGGLRLAARSRPDLDLQLWSSRPLPGADCALELEEGDRLELVLRWSGHHHHRRHRPGEELLEETAEVWRRWSALIDYEGPQKGLVHRSAIVLKMLDFFENEAIIAAPTSSLPEHIGGPRNWDYRFTWVRDAALAVYALRRVGLEFEASGFVGWVMDAVERMGRPRVMYAVDGSRAPEERIAEGLEGYLGSRPVRFGNAAVDQKQHDIFGEVLDCAWQGRRQGRPDDALWKRLSSFAERASREWRKPDHGIWEVRSPGHPYTYSAALCQVAVDRALRLARKFSLPAPAERWEREARLIAEAVLHDSWDDHRQALLAQLGGGDLDAALLALPLRRVVPADHPRMIATVRAIRSGLGAGKGLLYRYDPEKSPDGLPGPEGAFLLCSFWLADNLVLQGELEDGAALFDSLCQRANECGLLPEQIDPSTGAFLGNFPQALSHVGVIATGVHLAAKTATGGRE